jgi:hypothetical protein
MKMNGNVLIDPGHFTVLAFNTAFKGDTHIRFASITLNIGQKMPTVQLLEDDISFAYTVRWIAM